jgi:hypothetical protein
MRSCLLVFAFVAISMHLSSQTYGGGFMYHFYDSSVPPPYHRSYEIDIEDTVIKFTIDSYGDLLYDETFSVPRKQLVDFKTSLKKLNVKKQKPKVDHVGCTGGTSESFFFYHDDEKKYDFQIAQCGGKYYGDMKADLDKVRDLFKSMIPDFAKKLQDTRMN